MEVAVFSKDEWNKIAADAHKVCFGEERPVSANTFDFALAAVDGDQIFAYTTIIEMDNETAYMQHGGAFPSAKGTPLSRKSYGLMVAWLKERYKRISTRIRNSNIPMLKFAFTEGLVVRGCDCYEDGQVYLTLSWGRFAE